MLDNFSFLLPGKLAGSAEPGSWGNLREDLEFARSQGISGVVTLTERPLPRQDLAHLRLSYMHLPIVDYSPPSLAQIRDFVEFVDHAERAVLVHCRAGVGRTGTMLAAYLIAKGQSAAEAIATVRRKRPGSIETREQERVLYDWEHETSGGAGKAE
ncbi:MAG: hypothetical protein PWP23_2024 [Candidatus Sumerlaeota bacterium]|nr:hypothetical protein [Candidatus Sumerlaeota bacterium]